MNLFSRIKKIFLIEKEVLGFNNSWKLQFLIKFNQKRFSIKRDHFGHFLKFSIWNFQKNLLWLKKVQNQTELYNFFFVHFKKLNTVFKKFQTIYWIKFQSKEIISFIRSIVLSFLKSWISLSSFMSDLPSLVSLSFILVFASSFLLVSTLSSCFWLFLRVLTNLFRYVTWLFYIYPDENSLTYFTW